jgi:hypothetical protein
MTDRGLEITFSGSRVGEEWVDSARTITRATDATWTDGDEIGIYVLPAGATALTGATKPNSKYIYSSGSFSPASLDQTLYYPGNGTNINFVAYYPWNQSAGEAATANTVTFNFADQETQPKKEAVDFCFHRSTEPYSKTNAMTSMAFQHKFSKIRMTVNQGTNGIDPTTLTGVTLKDMPASATVNLNTLMSATDDTAVLSAFTISGTTDITAYIQSKTATQVVVEAIVAPHIIATGKTIELAFSGDPTRTYTFEQEFPLAPGKVYDFVFMLKEGGDGMTNCYMVKPGDPVTFPVSRVYKYNGTAFTNRLRVDNTTDYTGGFDAKVIWQDPSDLIVSSTSSGAGNTATVTVQTNNKSGNAVVGIYKTGETTLVWSYHIWVTSYTGEEAGDAISMVNGHEFMDRNLGATANDLSVAAYGLLYQWGRKDPFPGTASGSAGWNAVNSFSFGYSDDYKVTLKTADAAGIAAGIVESIQNPMKYYIKSSAHDWLPARENTLWRAPGGEKMIYDPCPEGWRVPVYVHNTPTIANSPWIEYDDQEYDTYQTTRTWDSTNTSWTFTRNGISANYPTTGLRSDTDEAEYIRDIGALWSATDYPTGASTFHWGEWGKVWSQFGSGKVNGHSVRCVRE